MQTRIILLAIAAVTILVMCYFAMQYYVATKHEKEVKKKYKGVINKLNHNKFIEGLETKIDDTELDLIFNKAKNPWHMSKATFQFIRYGGGLLLLLLSVILFVTLGVEYGLFAAALAFICWYYPLYYYKAVGDEREAEWNKFYEYIWVIKHNAMLYDTQKVFMNVRNYVQEHAPHNKEIIQGFSDFYEHWDPDVVPEYITKYYNMPIPKEIYQILFNMNQTGIFPEDNLNSLRQFIINSQDLCVEKTLSSVAGKATIFSLPFLMLSVIVSLMVPLVWQLLAFM